MAKFSSYLVISFMILILGQGLTAHGNSLKVSHENSKILTNFETTNYHEHRNGSKGLETFPDSSTDFKTPNPTENSSRKHTQAQTSLGQIKIIGMNTLNIATGSGWRLLTLNEAKQIQGNLMRIMGDWSIVAFSDGQLTGRGYGGNFLDRVQSRCGEYAVVKPRSGYISPPPQQNTPLSRLEQFAERIKRENVGKIYDSNWNQVVADGITIEQNINSFQFVQALNKLSLLTTSKISSNEFESKVALEVSPPLSAGVPIDKVQAEKKSENKKPDGSFSIKFSTNKIITTKISTCRMEVYEVDMAKIIKPTQILLNYFNDNFGGQVNEDSAARFFLRFGYWMPAKVAYGAEAYTESKREISSREISSSISVNVGSFVPALKVLNPTLSTEIRDMKKDEILSDRYELKGMKNQDVISLKNNDFNSVPINDIVPVRAYTMRPITVIIPEPLRSRLESTNYFQTNVRYPVMSVLTQFRNLFKEDVTTEVGGLGPKKYEFSSASMPELQNWAIVSMKGFKHRRYVGDYRLYKIRFAFRCFGNDKCVNQPERTFEAGVGYNQDFSRDPIGQIILDYATEKVNVIEIGIDKVDNVVGAIRITTDRPGAQPKLLGEEKQIRRWVPFNIASGFLTGVRGSQGDRVDSLTFFYRVTQEGMEARISKKIV